MSSEGTKSSCDSVLYKTRESKRVRKVGFKTTPLVSSPLELFSAKRCGCDVFTYGCLGEACLLSPYAPYHTGRMGKILTVKYSVPENRIHCYLVNVI